MPRDYIDLAQTDNLRRFEKLIDKAVDQIGRDPGFFNEYEFKFVKDIINKFDNDRPIWNPSLKQYNYLHTLVSSL